jgi:hypothetical protein
MGEKTRRFSHTLDGLPTSQIQLSLDNSNQQIGIVIEQETALAYDRSVL